MPRPPRDQLPSPCAIPPARRQAYFASWAWLHCEALTTENPIFHHRNNTNFRIDTCADRPLFSRSPPLEERSGERRPLRVPPCLPATLRLPCAEFVEHPLMKPPI